MTMTSVDPIQAELEALRSELATLRAERGAADGTTAAGDAAAAIADGATAAASAAASAAARKVTGWLNGLDTNSVLRELQDALGEASSVAEQSVANRPLVIIGSALLIGFLVGRLSRSTH